MANPLHQHQHGPACADFTRRDGGDARIALLVLGDELAVKRGERLLMHRPGDVTRLNAHLDRAGVAVLHEERRRVAPAGERLACQRIEDNLVAPGAKRHRGEVVVVPWSYGAHELQKGAGRRVMPLVEDECPASPLGQIRRVERDPLHEADRERLGITDTIPDDPGPHAEIALQRFDRLVQQGPRGHQIQGWEPEPRDGGRREDRLPTTGADVDDAMADPHRLVDDRLLVVA